VFRALALMLPSVREWGNYKCTWEFRNCRELELGQQSN